MLMSTCFFFFVVAAAFVWGIKLLKFHCNKIQSQLLYRKINKISVRIVINLTHDWYFDLTRFCCLAASNWDNLAWLIAGCCCWFMFVEWTTVAFGAWAWGGGGLFWARFWLRGIRELICALLADGMLPVDAWKNKIYNRYSKNSKKNIFISATCHGRTLELFTIKKYFYFGQKIFRNFP